MSHASLVQEIEATELVSILDRVHHKYAIYCLRDKERCGTQDEEAEELYWLNRIKAEIAEHDTEPD